jgi:hypothetical protein
VKEQQMKTVVLLFIASCLCLSCAGRYSQEVEEVLRQSGGNRSELEKVLKHYRRIPADSLKLRAAEFLIVNMPGKYSEYYDAPWNDVATVHLRWTSSSDKRRVLDAYKLGEPVVLEDIKCITAEYLINNIELSFKVWRERPWGKHIPFDAFCEEILPYRVDVEPLENWREKALASFADLDTVLNKPSMTVVEACSMVNDLLPRFRIDRDFPAMNFSQLMTSARGRCDDASALAIFSMRALGIPVTYEFKPRWVNIANGHSWNAVRDSTGKHISFMGADINPDDALPLWLQRMYHGIFEGTNQADFFDAKVLHVINHIPGMFYNGVTLRIPAKYRYVRYKSPEEGFRNVSEIEFYGPEGRRLSGAPVGTPGAWNSSNRICDKAFDGDVATYYDAFEKSVAWTGLDFHERKQIRKIRYLPRTEGRHIYEGHDYELFYRTGYGWLSLGKQTAINSGSLQYRAPVQALLYMENHTLQGEVKCSLSHPPWKRAGANILTFKY